MSPLSQEVLGQARRLEIALLNITVNTQMWILRKNVYPISFCYLL